MKQDLETAAQPLLGPKSEPKEKPEPEAQPLRQMEAKIGTVVGMIIIEGIMTVFVMGTECWRSRMFRFIVFVLYIFFSERFIYWNGWIPQIKIR